MGQFKPMVKMMTDEPSVILKLKKGGFVNKKKNAKEENGHKPMAKMAGGGDIAKLLSGIPMVGKPVAQSMAASPKKPSIVERMTIMKGKMPKMKDGGKSWEGSEEDEEQDKKLAKKHKMSMSDWEKSSMDTKHDKQKSMAGLKKGGKSAYKTGGVVEGQGGYKTGGVIEGQGGYKTGGVIDGQGGYKKGGSSKKAFATGGKVDSGHPVAMPQGRKPAPRPAIQQNLSGVYKKGGSVAMLAGGGAPDVSAGSKKPDITPDDPNYDTYMWLWGLNNPQKGDAWYKKPETPEPKTPDTKSTGSKPMQLTPPTPTPTPKPAPAPTPKPAPAPTIKEPPPPKRPPPFPIDPDSVVVPKTELTAAEAREAAALRAPKPAPVATKAISVPPKVVSPPPRVWPSPPPPPKPAPSSGYNAGKDAITPAKTGLAAGVTYGADPMAYNRAVMYGTPATPAKSVTPRYAMKRGGKAK